MEWTSDDVASPQAYSKQGLVDQGQTTKQNLPLLKWWWSPGLSKKVSCSHSTISWHTWYSLTSLSLHAHLTLGISLITGERRRATPHRVTAGAGTYIKSTEVCTIPQGHTVGCRDFVTREHRTKMSTDFNLQEQWEETGCSQMERCTVCV